MEAVTLERAVREKRPVRLSSTTMQRYGRQFPAHHHAVPICKPATPVTTHDFDGSDPSSFSAHFDSQVIPLNLSECLLEGNSSASLD
jgi:hypothetical protein